RLAAGAARDHAGHRGAGVFGVEERRDHGGMNDRNAGEECVPMLKEKREGGLPFDDQRVDPTSCIFLVQVLTSCRGIIGRGETRGVEIFGEVRRRGRASTAKSTAEPFAET